jgi:formylmethanofuran dehydrogenase subunit E
MMTFEPIGRVKNELTEKRFIKNAENIVSEIIIEEDYLDGLYKIDEQKYIDILFGFHQSEGYKMITPVFNGETRGVFASRSPNRPNGIGVTTVRLLERKGNKLVVTGLDALSDSPVFDIKPSDFSFQRNINSRDDAMPSRPRINIEKHISRGESRALLHQAGELHGHFCPGLSMGVMATMHVMDLMRQSSDGMEDLLAFVETNNCFSDGVQYVSGCTFGNNALIFQDYGKNALSLVDRNGRGFRVRAKNDIRQVIDNYFPDFNPLFEKVVVERNHQEELKRKFGAVSRRASFGMLNIPFDEMFDIQEVTVEIPDYAPIEESVECAECREVFMKSRGIGRNGEFVCQACRGIHHPFLDGYGIHCC